MVQCDTLTVFLCLMALLSETLCALTLEAEAGDKVTIWCQHDLIHTGYISWFKQTSDSVPLLIGCKKFRGSDPSETCYFFTESKRIVMSVHDKNTSLTVTSVNVSDTGLYYCSYMEQVKMFFSNLTSLHVKDGNKGNKISDREKGCIYSVSDAFFWMNAGFGAAIVILLTVLILKHRTPHTGAEAEDNKLSEKKFEWTHDELEYSYVVYSVYSPVSQ